MIRLLALTPSHNLRGGVESILQDLHADLPARGIAMTYGLARGLRFNDPGRFAAAFPGIEFIEVDGRRGDRDARRAGIRRAVAELRPDVVLVARMADALAALNPRRTGSPRVAVTLQSLEAEYLADLRDYAAGVDFCITSGELLRQLAIRFARMPEERVVSIPGGVEPGAGARGARQGDLRIGYAGRMDSDQKRVMDIPVILRELQRRGVAFSMVLAGDGPARAELQAALAGMPFEWLGWLERADLAARFHSGVDVFLHCAAWEGLSIAPREAMAHGVVPVLSRFPGWQFDAGFEEGVNCLAFSIGDTSVAAEHLQRLSADRGLLARMSEAASRSQGGIRSRAGAADAWAGAIRRTVELAPRCGRISAPEAPDGLLARGGIPASLRGWLRDLLGRSHHHRTGGGEWPHCLRLATAGEREDLAGLVEAICRG